MSIRTISCVLGSVLGCVVAWSSNFYVIEHDNCDVDAVKATTVGVVSCLASSLLQVVVACSSVNRIEKGVIFACSQISLLASALFFGSAVVILDCVKEDSLQSDSNPLQQAILLQMVALELLCLSAISEIVTLWFYLCKNKKSEELEPLLMKV